MLCVRKISVSVAFEPQSRPCKDLRVTSRRAGGLPDISESCCGVGREYIAEKSVL